MDSNDQGLQNGGAPPEPSQIPEGDNPVPSQENTGQLTDQELEQKLPDQDDRGVPTENVLGEMRRKMDKVMEELTSLKSMQHNSYQQPQQFQQVQQPYQQPNMQEQQAPQRQEQVAPRNADEVADIIDRECRDKYGAAFNAGTADYWEIEKFRDKRRTELSQAMVNARIKSVEATNVIKTEREKSFGRISGLYPDLINIQSNLAQAVLREAGRRAYTMGMSPQAYLEKDPYAIESITPMVASQLGIGAKAQSQPKIIPRQPNLPPSNFPGKQTQVQNDVKPTQADIDFGKRFKVDPKALAKVRNTSKNPEDNSFIDESGILYS